MILAKKSNAVFRPHRRNLRHLLICNIGGKCFGEISWYQIHENQLLLHLIAHSMEAVKKWYFIGIFPKWGVGGSGSPKLYVKFWWPLFLALKTPILWPKVTFLYNP